MPNFLLELALFFRARLDSFWIGIILDWTIKKVRDEYLDIKIQKYENHNAELKLILERERERRRAIQH